MPRAPTSTSSSRGNRTGLSSSITTTPSKGPHRPPIRSLGSNTAVSDATALMLHRRRGLPDNWVNIVEEYVAVWRVLDDGERDRLEAASDSLLRHKHWEAARGVALV